MNAHSNVALPLAHLRHAFDALKRSATALLARPHAPYTSTTLREHFWVVLKVDISKEASAAIALLQVPTRDTTCAALPN